MLNELSTAATLTYLHIIIIFSSSGKGYLFLLNAVSGWQVSGRLFPYSKLQVLLDGNSRTSYLKLPVVNIIRITTQQISEMITNSAL
jgi:hypothetical protein